MKKSSKSSLGHRSTGKAKSKKPVVIFIYGPIAVGKLTVATALSKRLKYKLVHNHYISDFVDNIFERHSYDGNWMKEHLRYLLPENMAKAGNNFIWTHCYCHDFISKTGLSDPEYVKTLERKITRLGAKFYPIHLKASPEELLKRVSMSSRKAFLKLKNKKIMKKYLNNLDFRTSPKLKNNLIIDNTNLSPKKVANMIIKHFRLKL